MFSNELYFYIDKEDGIYIDCKYCYYPENTKTVKKIESVGTEKYIDEFEQCKFCGNQVYADKQMNKHLNRYRKAIEFDKIRWL